jgi:hypothetical protein
MWQQTVFNAMYETFPDDAMSYRIGGRVNLSFSSMDEEIFVFMRFENRNLARRVGVSLPNEWLHDDGHKRKGEGRFNLRTPQKSFMAIIVDEYNPINVSSSYDVGFLISEDEIAAVIRQMKRA